MSKDMVYFELIEACKSVGCPICALIKRITLQSMEGFLYESVNDPNIRKQLIASRGLCNYHSNLLLSMGDPLSHAVIYTDLLELAIKDIERDCFYPYEEHPHCLFCQAEQEAEEIYSTAFLNLYCEKGLQDAYEQGGVLCMSHLHTIESIAKKNGSDRLYKIIKNTTIKKYKELLFSLSEIKRKSDYRYSDEKWTDTEKDAWKVAGNVINGISNKKKDRKE